MKHKILSVPKAQIYAFSPEDILNPEISLDRLQAVKCDPIHVANDLYYRTVSSLHSSSLGFRTPSSHYHDPLGAALASRCFINKVRPWMQACLNGHPPTAPLTIAEMGGGEGILLKSFLTHLLDLVLHEASQLGLSHFPWKSWIQLVLLDQSPQFLAKQKTCANSFGITVVDTEPIDLGKPLSISPPPAWTELLGQNKIDFLYTCELLDDVSGGYITGKEIDRWYRYSTLFIVPIKELDITKINTYIPAKCLLNDNILCDYPGRQYVLNHDQIVEHLERLVSTNQRSFYRAIPIKEPIQAPKEALMSSEDCIYTNPFLGIKEIFKQLCAPDVDMLHMDYYTTESVKRIGFYPESLFYDIPEAWGKLMTQLSDIPVQQPTVHVSMPHVINTLTNWPMQEFLPSHLRPYLEEYRVRNLELNFPIEDTEFCMAQHNLIATLN